MSSPTQAPETGKKRHFPAWLLSLDLLLYFAFFLEVTCVAARLSEPVVREPATVTGIFLAFTLSAGATLVIVRRLARSGTVFDGLRSMAGRLVPTNRVFLILSGLTWAITVAVSISVGITMSRHADLISGSLGFGLRAITTSIHPLAPLELKLVYLFYPLVLFYPAGRNRLSIAVKFGTYLFYLFWLGLTQLKFGFIFGLAASALYWSSSNSPVSGRKSRWAAAGLFGALLILALYHVQTLPPTDYETVKAAPSLSKLDFSDPAWKHDPNSPCHGMMDSKPLPIPGSTWDRLKYTYIVLEDRAFSLPGQMSRLFICLRDQGWRPRFRGSSFFRFLGNHHPYYRWAYEEFRPGLGTSINSAVVILPVDSYFNAGWWGVVCSGVLLAILWSILFAATSFPGYEIIAWYFRVYFFSVISGSGMVQGFFTLVPLFMLIGLEYLNSRLFSQE